ncbi:MAG: DUF6647 family protein, partial [Aquiluna sp.]
MKEIITALMIWLGANSDFNVNMDIPTVMFLPQDKMEQQYYKGRKHADVNLHAFYDTENDIIVLPDTWDRRKPWDLSVLLHEIIHYVQDQNEVRFNCVQEMEVKTWPLQQKYLQQVHDVDWDYDRLWHFM